MQIFSKEYISSSGERNSWMEIFSMPDYIVPDSCKEVQLWLILTGTLRCYTEGKYLDFSDDDVFIINPGQLYSLQTVEAPCYVLRLSMGNIVRFSGQIDRYFGNTFLCQSNEETRNNIEFRLIRQYLFQIWKSFLNNERLGQIEVGGRMIILQAHLVKHFTTIQHMPIMPPHVIDEKLLPILRYTEEHFQLPLTLDEVSAMAGKNRSYFSSYFKRQMGYGWYFFLTCLRLRAAVELLNETDSNLTQVAFSSGFYDNKSFFTAFKRFFALSPREYRQVNLNRRKKGKGDVLNEHSLTQLMERYQNDGG